MNKKSLINYIAVLLLGVLIYSSNFLDTDLFNFGEKNFAVWFVLSLLCFACGWYINKVFQWSRGGKIVFAVIVGITFVSILMITFFADYFGANELLTENLILFSLRNITLGLMAFFGLAIQEVIHTRRNTEVLEGKVKQLETETDISRKDAELIIKEANLNAKQIVNDATIEAKKIISEKERVERELKEFIQTERELIKKYEKK
ncbi:MAG: hypothetical protein IH819_01315 [Bacteroidetes bacterium]|nr:hypothetical protein [Bacteroidota bacterium]